MFLSDLPRARLDFLKLKRAALQFALCVCRFSTVADVTDFVAEKVRVSAAVARVGALPRAYIRARLPAVTP